MLFDREYAKSLAENFDDNPPAYQNYLDQLTPRVALDRREILGVRSRRGLVSLYYALRGATRVVSLKAELKGSILGAIEVQPRLRDQLGLSQLELLAVDFDAASLLPESFDLITMNAVINHLDEIRLPLQKHAIANNRFVEIASEIRSLLRTCGVAVITDTCRYSFWTQVRRFGLPRRLCYSRRTRALARWDRPRDDRFAEFAGSRSDFRKPASAHVN